MPVAPERRPRRAGLLLFIVCLSALVLRLIALDARPLHHDEAVNWWFVSHWSHGSFRYDPANYHGPLLFWLGALVARAGDFGEWTLRFPVAVLGAAACALLWPLRRALGSATVLAFALFTAASTVLLWLSRYFIHELPLIVCLGWAAVAGAIAVRSHSRAAWVATALAVACALALKETAWVGVGILGAAGLVAAQVSGFGAARFLGALFGRGWLGAPAATLGVVAALLLLIALYSTGGRHFAGVGDFLGGFAAWTRTGLEGAGHAKPWWYHLALLGRYEAPLLLAALAAVPALRARDACAWFALSVFGLTVLAYSLSPYKTPWLVGNAVLPLVALAARGIATMPRPGTMRLASAAAVALATLVLAVRLNFIRATDAAEPMVYVHHTQTVRDFARRLDALAGPDGRLAVVSTEQWPLPFYLRHRRVAYHTELPAPIDAQVVALDTRIAEVPPEHRRVDLVHLRPGQAYAIYVR